MLLILDHIEHPGAGAGLLVQLEDLMITCDHAPVRPVGVPLGIPPAIHEVPGAEHGDTVALATPVEGDGPTEAFRHGDWRSDAALSALDGQDFADGALWSELGNDVSTWENEIEGVR